jgi:hypothetical protein
MRLSVSSLASATLLFTAAASAQFAPGGSTITGTTGAQTLSGGTGTVNSGGRISTSGSTVGVTISGTSTLNNSGTIEQTGSGRAIDNNTNNANLTINNSGLISSNTGEAFRVNTAGTSVQLTNSGTIQAASGALAINWANIATGTNILNNLLGGSITAVGQDAVRPGHNGVVNNAGLIAATPTGGASPSGSDGIDLRTNRTVTVTNTGTIRGRHGIATDGNNAGPSSLTVNNNAGTIEAVNGSGINVDGVSTSVVANVTNLFGATIKGGVLAIATEGDGDGIDVDGVLTLNNSGDVLGLGARAGNGAGNNAEGIAAGGGSIFNFSTGRIIGSTLASDDANGDPSRAGNGILIDNSDGGNAIAATSVINSGLIQGKSGFGIKFVGTFADTITNNAGGTIRGAGTGAAIQTGGGADIVTNGGSIISDIGDAIDLEAGDDQLIVIGGAAGITGNVSGGAGANTMRMNLGSGNTFSYAGVLSNFSTVTVESGEAKLSGVNTYTGQTVVNGGTLVLDGVNRINSGSGLVLNGGTLEIESAGGTNGQTFSSLTLSASSIIDLGQSSLTFNGLGSIDDGDTLTILNWDSSTSPDYAFRILGDTSGVLGFFTLLGNTTINGFAAISHFDGTYTNVNANAVPLPAAGFLLLSGLGVFGALGRRRRNTAQAVAA